MKRGRAGGIKGIENRVLTYSSSTYNNHVRDNPFGKYRILLHQFGQIIQTSSWGVAKKCMTFDRTWRSRDSAARALNLSLT